MAENLENNLPENPPPEPGRFLKLEPHFYLLWLVLWVLVTVKVLAIRGSAAGDLAFVAIFGVIMFGVPYLAAWAVWRFSGRDVRKAEFAFLAVSAVVFLIPTITLYREGFAAVG